MNWATFFLCTVIAWLTSRTNANLDEKRVHFVDLRQLSNGATNMLFRSNMPINTTTLAYDQLVAVMKNRTQQEAPAGTTFPEPFYLLDLSLDNVFEPKDTKTEKSFWQDPAHSKLGGYLNWPIGTAGLASPKLYSKADIFNMSAANGSVWVYDHIPQRMQELKSMLETPHESGLPLVVLVHCEAGCDRTGQFAGSWRMNFQRTKTVAMYAKDVTECGRPPNYYGTMGLEWYCYYLQLHAGINPGECTAFAKCKLGGDCTPTNMTRV